ncbi:MAG TPA: tRNA glutamyl-Q(34) synthetase GluQRS, partial [Burkholderiales bacterium]
YLHLPVAVDARGEKLSKQNGAAPVLAADPLPGLLAALAFLDHPPPPALARGSVREIWAWALENWDSGRLPQKRTIRIG